MYSFQKLGYNYFNGVKTNSRQAMFKEIIENIKERKEILKENPLITPQPSCSSCNDARLTVSQFSGTGRLKNISVMIL